MSSLKLPRAFQPADAFTPAVSALKSYCKAAGLGIDPSNAREKDVPVGLRVR